MPLQRIPLPPVSSWFPRLAARVIETRQLLARTMERQRPISGAERQRLRAAGVALQIGSPRERWEAAATLGRGPASAAVAGALVEALSDDEPFVRAEAGNALVRFGIEAAREPLQQALRSSQPSRMAGAAETLGRLRDAESVGLLLDALAAEEPAVRTSVAEALGRIGSAEALPALLTALDDPVPAVRWAAAGALGHLGSAEASATLSARLVASVRRGEAARQGRRRRGDLAVGEPAMVRRRLAWALGRAGAGEEAVAALVAALDDADAEVRRLAAEALGALGDASASPALEAHLEDFGDGGGGPVAETARAALSALRNHPAPIPPAPEPHEESHDPGR
jgi:HEAT repeat protein